MSKIKFGIIGTNFISDWFADAVSKTDCAVCHAVYSRTSEKGADFAARHGIGKVYTDIEEFFSCGIDAVYVASPNCKHCEQTLAAISHGLHVLCEKPIASNHAEFLKMRSAAEKAGVVLLEAMRVAFDPALEAIRSTLPRLGKIRRASLEYCQYSSRYDKFREGVVLQAFKPEFSNASLMDIGVYPVHLCLRLFGYPTESINSFSTILENGFEGSGQILLGYKDFSVTIAYAKTFDSENPSIICGEDASLLIDKVSPTSRLTLIHRGGKREDVPFAYRSDNMVFEVEEFARLVKGGNCLTGHADYSDMEMRLLDTVRAQNGIRFPADSL